MGIIFVAAYLLIHTVSNSYFLLQTNGTIWLEMKMFYSPNDLYDMIGAYGQHGRAFYIQSSLLIDFVFPMQYSIFFMSLSHFLLKKILFKSVFTETVFYLGIALCLSDWLENVFLILAVQFYPKEITPLARLANVMTLLKKRFNHRIYYNCNTRRNRTHC
jgi:hypothetical protein